MATTKEFHDFAVETLNHAVGYVHTRPMMGEYLVYFRGVLIGDLCDNCFFLKETPVSQRLLPDAERAYPYKGSKTLMVVLDEWEDFTLLSELLEGTFAALKSRFISSRKEFFYAL